MMSISAPALATLQRAFVEAPELADRELYATMIAVTQALEGEVKDAMPKRTGLTAASVNSDVSSTPAGLLGVVGSASPIALFIEEGTKPHEIRAIHAKALAFHVGEGGPMIFAKAVRHPGTKAQHIFAKTLDRNEGNIVRQFENAAERIAQQMVGGAA
jgi:hypothetical protein